MSVDFNSMPRDEPGLGDSDAPMFAPVPAWERNRKRRGFGGKARIAAPEVAVEPTPVRNAAYVETDDEAFAPTPTYATRTVKKSGVAPLAIAVGIVAIGGLAAAGWYATQNRDTGMAQLTPGTEVASAPVAPPPELTASAASAPTEPSATDATPAKAETPPAHVITRVAAAAPARTRPAATSRSAEDAGVNSSATLPAAPQPYSGAAAAPSAPADIAPAPATPVAPAAPAADATPVTAPAAATPPVTTPPQ